MKTQVRAGAVLLAGALAGSVYGVTLTLPQQPQNKHLISICSYIKVSDKRPQRNVISSNSNNLIHELVLQPC